MATVDAKHQVVVRYGTTCRRPAFGDGSEAQHLESVIDSVEERFREIDPETEIFEEVVVTADSGFNNEEAMKVLQDRSIDAFVADPQFRSSRSSAHQPAGVQSKDYRPKADLEGEEVLQRR
jgi:hypothetical protein